MVLRGLVLLCPLTPLDTAVFARFDGGGEEPRCPLTPLDTAVFYSFDGGVEGMVVRGLVLWCPLPPS